MTEQTFDKAHETVRFIDRGLEFEVSGDPAYVSKRVDELVREYGEPNGFDTELIEALSTSEAEPKLDTNKRAAVIGTVFLVLSVVLAGTFGLLELSVNNTSNSNITLVIFISLIIAVVGVGVFTNRYD